MPSTGGWPACWPRASPGASATAPPTCRRARRYYLTGKGHRRSRRTSWASTRPRTSCRAYPVSREWLTLLIHRMDAAASIYRLAASLSPGIDGLRTQVDFHRRGRFDAVITRHDGRSFGVVRQGPALRRRSLFDRLRAIAEYGYRRRPGTVLVLTPSVWEQRLTTRFCENANLEETYVAVESREALEDWNSNAWRYASWVFGSLPYSLEFISTPGSPNRGRFAEPPERKRASLPEHGADDFVGRIRLRPNLVGKEDAGPDHRPPDDSPGSPGPLAGRLRGEGQPDAAQSREWLGPTGTPGQARRHPLHPVGGGHTLRHPPGPGAAADDAGHLEHGTHHGQPGPQAAPGPPHRDLGAADQARRRGDLVPVGAGGGGPGNNRLRANVVHPHGQDRPGLQLGGVGHRPGRRGEAGGRWPPYPLLPGARAARPATPGESWHG